MKLQPITGTSMESLYQLFDVEYYKRRLEQCRRYADRHGLDLDKVLEWARYAEEVFQARRMMTDLLHQLEAVEHAPVFVSSSMHCLYLTDVNDHNRWLVSVQAYTQGGSGGSPFFQVGYGLEPPWHQATGYTKDVAEAVVLVLDGLDRATPRERRPAAWG